MLPSTEVATNAPSAMKTPCPKFSTSISPNTSVRPDAMMKMIMPIARPAAVSVTHVELDPMKGKTSRASAGTRASGFQSRSFMRSTSRSYRQPQQRLLQGLVFGQRLHRAGMDHETVVHDGHGVAQALGEIDVLLDQQQRHATRLELREGIDHVVDDGGRQAFAGFV